MHSLILALACVLGQSGDPTGFTEYLNAARVVRGLPEVTYDSNAAKVAEVNNSHQLVRGLGHHVLGGYGQCAAVGIPDVQSVLNAWLGSPSHAAIILDPGLRSVGCHGVRGCWTASTDSMGGTAIWYYQRPGRWMRRR